MENHHHHRGQGTARTTLRIWCLSLGHATAAFVWDEESCWKDECMNDTGDTGDSFRVAAASHLAETTIYQGFDPTTSGHTIKWYKRNIHILTLHCHRKWLGGFDTSSTLEWHSQQTNNPQAPY